MAAPIICHAFLGGKTDVNIQLQMAGSLLKLQPSACRLELECADDCAVVFRDLSTLQNLKRDVFVSTYVSLNLKKIELAEGC